MPLNLMHLRDLMKDLVTKPNLEENLSQIIRFIEESVEFQSTGVFLKNTTTKAFFLKIGRNLSHHFTKTSTINKNSFLWNLVHQNETRVYESPEDIHFEHTYKQLLVVPLLYLDKQIGFFFIDRARDKFSEEEIELLEVFADLFSIVAKLHIQQDLIDTLTEYNEVTELYNYRSFIKHGKQQFALAQRYNFPLTIVILRMNKFAKSLQTFGSKRMNTTLALVSDIIKSRLRTTDIIGYIFSDTYALLLPETDSTRAIEAIERLEFDLKPYEDISALRITWGISEISEEENTLESLISSAEEKAYEASRLLDKNIVS
jgi:diguanylate cyclase (GGDEF)-like protein